MKRGGGYRAGPGGLVDQGDCGLYPLASNRQRNRSTQKCSASHAEYYTDVDALIESMTALHRRSQKGLEDAIAKFGAELDAQYVISFVPEAWLRAITIWTCNSPAAVSSASAHGRATGQLIDGVPKDTPARKPSLQAFKPAPRGSRALSGDGNSIIQGLQRGLNLVFAGGARHELR